MEQRTPSKTTGTGPFSPQSAKSTGRQTRGRRAAEPLASLPSNVQSDLPALEEEEVATAAAAAKRGGRARGASAGAGASTPGASGLTGGEENARGVAAAPRRRGGRAAGGGGTPGGGGDDDDSMDVDGGAPRGGAGGSQGAARTPLRSRGGAASPGGAGAGTPGAGALRTPLSVPRPEFGRPMGGARMSSLNEEEAGDQRFIWGSKFRTADMAGRVRRFLGTYYDPARDAAAGGGGRGQPTYMQLLREMVLDGRFGLNVDMADVYACDRLLYQVTVDYPTDMVLVWDEEATHQALELVQELGGEAPPLEEAVQVRPFNLRAEQTRSIRDLDPLNLDTLVAVRGMVTRTGTIIPDLRVAEFRCESCHGEQAVRVEEGAVTEPTVCRHCGAKHNMRLLPNRGQYINRQIVKMQEDPSSVPEGETPRSLLMYAFDTNVDGAKPGDKVTMTGIFRATRIRVNPRQRAVHALFKTYLDVVHVARADEARMFKGGDRATAAPAAPAEGAEGAAPPATEGTQPGGAYGDVAGANVTREEVAEKERRFREMASDPDHVSKLVRSVAPKVIEMDGVKKGLLCQLFGGVSKSTGGPGGKGGIRGDINVLVVGDPSVSKSQLLAFVHHVAPRGIYTSGKGSSAVGLTAYVTKDPETNEMVLESGALVLSDQGICCIDEFDKMSDGARAMLHEVMEQQTVSVAKAGLVSQLNARTSILACANPKGSRYLPELSLTENINLPPTLLSRFDLLYLVLDARTEGRDRALGRHLVSLFQRDLPESAQPPYSIQELREFVAFARARITPRFTDAAAAALVARYKQLRRQGRTAQVVVATPRQLEALIRLSEAWARMHLREEVVEDDVTNAYNLWYDAISVSAADESGRLDIDTLATGASAAQQRFLQELPALLREILGDMFRVKPSCSVNELLDAYNAGLAAQQDAAGGGAGAAGAAGPGADQDGAAAAAARRRRVTSKQLLAALYQLTDIVNVRGMVVTQRRAGAAGGGDE